MMKKRWAERRKKAAAKRANKAGNGIDVLMQGWRDGFVLPGFGPAQGNALSR